MRAAGVNSGGILVDVPDDAFLVHNESGAVGGTAIFVENPVLLGDGSFEIAEEGISDAELLGILPVGKPAVDADAENLRVGFFEFGDISLIRLELLCSPSRKRQNVERQDDVLFSLKIAELYFLTFCVRQSEIRRTVSDAERRRLHERWDCQRACQSAGDYSVICSQCRPSSMH